MLLRFHGLGADPEQIRHRSGAGPIDLPEMLRWLVCDAMTSGGLLAAVPAASADEIPGVVVGRLVAGAPGTISAG